MCDELTTGVSDPARPGHWLVPPWPVTAAFSEVVRHFLRFLPLSTLSTAQLLAYYEAYVAALENAPTGESPYPIYDRWCADVHRAIDRCAALYRDKRAAEARTSGEIVRL